MGNTYILHTEAKINNEWRCIDGYYMLKRYDDSEEKLVLAHTYESGSRSYFSDTYDKLSMIGKSILFSELSKEIQNEYPDFKYEENFLGEGEEEEAYYKVVSLRDFDACVPMGFSRHGIVHKDKISDFENRETDEIWDESEEIAEIPEIARSVYQYYEWDAPYEWPYHFKKLKKMIDETVNKYFDNAWYFGEREVRIVVFMF